MNKTVIFVALLLLCNRCMAQYTDSTHYYINANSTGSLNKTTDGDTYLLNNGLKFGVKRKDVTLNFTNAWVYGAEQQKLTNNDFASSLDFNLYKTFPHFFYWGLANYTTSYSLKIVNQAQTGAGIAYNFLDKKNALLNLSDGILYENSDLVVQDTTRDKYSTLRNSLRLVFRFEVNGLVTINSSNFLQNSLSNQDDYIIKSSVSLGIKVKKWLTLTTAFNYNEISRTKKENLQVTYGLVVENYF